MFEMDSHQLINSYVYILSVHSVKVLINSMKLYNGVSEWFPVNHTMVLFNFSSV